MYCVAHVALENCKQWSTGNNTNNNNINNNKTLLLLFSMIIIIGGSSHFKDQVSICVFVKWVGLLISSVSVDDFRYKNIDMSPICLWNVHSYAWFMHKFVHIHC